MRRRSRALGVAALTALAGCTLLEPYPNTPANEQPSDRGPRVAICYNPLHTTLARVRQEAQAECPAATIAEPVETDFYLQVCSLFLPSRASFVCAPKK